MSKAISQIILLTCLFITGRAVALTIDNSSSALNDRFANDPSFIMSNYDLSGVGRSEGGRWGTLVSRNVFVSANHFPPSTTNGSLTFYKTNDPTGESININVASGQRIGSSDVWVGVLERPVPVGYAVYDLATANINNTAQFNSSVYHDLNAFLVGQSPFNNFGGARDVAVGRNVLDFFPTVNAEGTTDRSIAASINNAQDVTNEAGLVQFDSGAPLLVDLNENDNDYSLQLVGANWYIGTLSGTELNGFTYLGNYDTQIQAIIDNNPVPLLGDLNGNDVLDSLDIDAFILALIDPGTYSQTYTTLNADVRGDFDENGVLDNLDIFGFVETITLSGVLTTEDSALFEQLDLSSVPEPTSLALFGFGGLLVLSRRHRQVPSGNEKTHQR
ncbi:MAG: PEP-CTERM sorting domain-containing protein [Planctomycetota bacterium]